jgi:hypothetical protein
MSSSIFSSAAAAAAAVLWAAACEVRSRLEGGEASAASACTVQV